MNRIVTTVFGLLFIGVAGAIVLYPDGALHTGAVVAAVLIGGLGVEALVSALRDRPSLLSRIGPLP